jgi:transmembrane sensor
MKFSHNEAAGQDRIEQDAAEWLARLDDGLSGEEQDAYVEWLSKDERHRKAMSLLQWGWGELDRLAGLHLSEHPPLKKSRRPWNRVGSEQAIWYTRYRVSVAAAGLAAAVAISFVSVFLLNRAPVEQQPIQPAYELMQRLARVDLPDGSVVELNHGASIKTDYSAEKRLVFLNGGEANFVVAKDPDRPFVVSVAGIEVEAVGTIFNVKYVGQTVNVIVSEGKVQLNHKEGPILQDDSREPVPVLTVGQQAAVTIEKNRPIASVQNLDEAAFAAALNWQPRLLRFEAAPLSEIVAGFNRHNQVQLEIEDPELSQMILTSSFWSDNLEGFVSLMESNFGMRAVWVERERLRLVPNRASPTDL